MLMLDVIVSRARITSRRRTEDLHEGHVFSLLEEITIASSTQMTVSTDFFENVNDLGIARSNIQNSVSQSAKGKGFFARKLGSFSRAANLRHFSLENGNGLLLVARCSRIQCVPCFGKRMRFRQNGYRTFARLSNIRRNVSTKQARTVFCVATITRAIMPITYFYDVSFPLSCVRSRVINFTFSILHSRG